MGRIFHHCREKMKAILFWKGQNMKKLLIILLLMTVLLSVSTTGVYAYRLSYAASCLAKGIELVKSGIYGQDITFNDADIKQALTVTGFDKLTIRSLPSKELGILKLGKVAVTVGQVITRENIQNLVFSPSGKQVEEACFTFTCDKLCGGAEITCRLRFTHKENQAPTTSGVKDTALHVWTQKNMTVFGSMIGNDPEGDDITYMVISYPQKGTLTVMNESLGDFKYTPKSGFRGNDSFTYVARDSYGNYSLPTTVTIRVSKRVVDITYDDMENHSAANAAMVMEYKKIMQGQIEGDGYYFNPSGVVSKEDFVVMAMKALGIAPKSDATSTFFDDDGSINENHKAYIATAQRYGYIVGEFTGKELLFHPSDSITRGEAATILARMMGADSEYKEVFQSASGNAVGEKVDAIVTLYQMGVFDHKANGELMEEESLTRAEAAEIFLSFMDEYR